MSMHPQLSLCNQALIELLYGEEGAVVQKKQVVVDLLVLYQKM
jgi:hypothetical protein